jgi:hypothetical protein
MKRKFAACRLVLCALVAFCGQTTPAPGRQSMGRPGVVRPGRRAAGASAGSIPAPVNGTPPERQEISGGYTRDFKSPFNGDAVLLLTLS